MVQPPEVVGVSLTSHGVVFAVLPGWTVQVPDWVAAKDESLETVTLGIPAPPVPVPVEGAVPAMVVMMFRVRVGGQRFGVVSHGSDPEEGLNKTICSRQWNREAEQSGTQYSRLA